MDTISIIKPDDWHLHLRDTPYMEKVVTHSANQFSRAIIMPNLTPPVRTSDDAEAYRQRILSALPEDTDFQPLMTLYLTDNTSKDDIRKAASNSHIVGLKLYPAGATTNSDAGVTDIKKIYPVLECMQQHNLVLQVHGESNKAEVDVFDREKVFIEQSLDPVRQHFPQLRIVFEHITTSNAVEYVNSADDHLAATITPHHLLINRNAMFAGGMRPHHYCLPVAKREHHRLALLAAATKGSERFFAGTDSAPHARNKKESSCGCAGIYSAFSAIELYAEAFETTHTFSNFEAFMSLNGPAFYQLPVNQGKITLQKMSWSLPHALEYVDDELIPFKAGEELMWRLYDNV
jgi:dihydroorotase